MQNRPAARALIVLSLSTTVRAHRWQRVSCFTWSGKGRDLQRWCRGLERRTKPLSKVPTYERTANLEKCLMNVCSSFVAHLQPLVAIQPRVSPLDHPAIEAKLLLRLHTLPGALDPTLTQRSLVLLRLIALIRMQLVGPFARSSSWTSDRLDGIEGGFEHRCLVDVGCSQQDRERDSLPVDHKMALCALFAAIRWILPGFSPPGRPPWRHPSKPGSSRCNRLGRVDPTRLGGDGPRRQRLGRQQVIPEPHPISGGSISHGVPVIRTKRIPVKAARSATGGRPPLGRGFRGGSKGSMTDHNSSGTIGWP